MARRTIPGWGRFSGIRTRRVRFGGRVWCVVAVDHDEEVCSSDFLEARDGGAIHDDTGTLAFRTTADRDLQIIRIIHELSHNAYPGAKESVIESGDAKFKESLEAFGVDLSPLLRGYE